MRQKIIIKNVFSSPNERPLLSKAFDTFILDYKSRQLSPNTIANYQNVFKYFQNYTSDIPLEEVTSELVKEWMVYLQEQGCTANTVRGYLKCLKAFFRFHEHSIIINSPKEDKKVLECYTQEEIRKLLTKPKKLSFASIRDYTIVCFLLATGVRCSTCINVKVKDINFSKGLIFLHKTKTRKQYYIPLSNTLKRILKEYLSIWEHKTDDWLFPTMYGDQISAETLKKAIKYYHQRKGVSTYSVHKYRRTFATHHLKQCNNIIYLQQLLGHSDIATTRKYVTVNVEDLQNNFDSYNPLDNMIKKGIKIKE